MLVQSCKKESPDLTPDQQLSQLNSKKAALNTFDPINGQVKIAIVSDIHYISSSLVSNNGFQGQAFQTYLATDPKLIELSKPLLLEVIDELKKARPDLVLIPGDLTKDGEKLSHKEMKQYLAELENDGMKVYVVPGNHDINNPEARGYDGNNAYITDHITKAEFVVNYSDFGYGTNDPTIKYRDANSLSYVAEPFKGLWILAIDPVRYEENTTSSVTGGRIKESTMNWLLPILKQATDSHVTVLGLMHHNLVEHYQYQSVLDPGYVIENSEQRASQLLAAGLKVIFTGHYHASDITPFYKNGQVLYDIQTGSPVEPPSTYRIVTLKNKDLDVSTFRITSVNATIPGGMSFVEYSNMFLSQHLDGYFNYIIPLVFPGTSPELTQYAAPLYRNAVMAHFAGDEKISPDQQRKIDSLPNTMLKVGVTSFWTDLGIKDNKVPLKGITVQ
jgi:predicted MPP superfamily phosphohydrolase